MKRNKVLIISGATATGKTNLSIEIASKFTQQKFEIVNFDSLLFYNELNIGSAKPSIEEQRQIKHHLINISSIDKEINANEFESMCTEKINQLHNKDIIPILTGGSTFYLRSYIKGMYDSITVSPELREEIDYDLENKGIDYFINFLKTHDPKIFDVIHENDQYRIIRAYEHYKMTDTRLSEEKQKLDKNLPYNFSINQHPKISFEHISLNIEKDMHWEIMKTRAKLMIKNGLIDEVKNILTTFDGTQKPLASIGYKEVISFINGEISNIEDLAELIYINTRKLAKAQKTFLKKVSPKHTINPLTDADKIYKIVDEFLRKVENV